MSKLKRIDTTMLHCYEVRAAGIPCHALVTHYSKGWGGSYWEPAEAPEVYFELYDRKGYRAEWLERRLSEASYNAIEQELINCIESK